MTVDELVEYRSLIFASAMKMARNRDVAEDLTQSVYVKALEALPRFDGRYPKAWLLKILYHCFLDFKRREHRYTPLKGEGYESGQDVPRQAIARMQLAQVISEADPLVLAAMLAKQNHLACDNLSVNAVHSRICRGRKVLRAKYEIVSVA